MGSSESKISQNQSQDQNIQINQFKSTQNDNREIQSIHYSIQNDDSKRPSQHDVKYSQYLDENLNQNQQGNSIQQDNNMEVPNHKQKVISSQNIEQLQNNNNNLQNEYVQVTTVKDDDQDYKNLYNVNRGRQTSGSQYVSEIPDSEYSDGCCFPQFFSSKKQSVKSSQYSTSTLSSSQFSFQKKMKKYKKQKLKDSEWFQYLKEICIDQYNERSNFYRQLQMELKAQYKMSDSRNHKQFVHQFSLQSLEESQKIFQKHLDKYMEKSSTVRDDPFMMNALQTKLLEELMRETELMNEAKLSIDFEKSIRQDQAQQFSQYQATSQQRQGLKSFLRAGSHTSFKFKNSESSNYSTMPMKKQNQFMMNNTTLIYDAQNLTENEKIYTSVYFYKQITKLIEKQIKMRSHPLGFIRSFFQAQFKKKFDPNIQQPVDIYDMSQQFSDFIEFYLDIIRVYYDLDELLNDFPLEVDSFLTEENLSNYISCILFSNQPFYDNIMYHLGREDETKVKTHFCENIKQLKFKNIEFFDIPADFQLNQNTIDYNVKKGNVLEVDLRSKQTSYASQISKNEFFEPYSNVIQYFKKLDQVTSPLHKLKIIIKTTQMIDEAIKNFYSENNLMLGKKVHYDADQFISLFVYIIIQSQSYNLYENCRLIDNFTYRGTLNSASGYLLVTLTGCVHHIASLKVNEIEKYSVKDSYSMQSMLNTPSQFRVSSSSTLNQRNFQQNLNQKYEFTLKQNNEDQDQDLDDFSNKKGEQQLLKKQKQNDQQQQQKQQQQGELIDQLQKLRVQKHGLSENLEEIDQDKCSEDNNNYKKNKSEDNNTSVFLDQNTFSAKQLTSDISGEIQEDQCQEQTAGGTNSQEYETNQSVQTPIFKI